MSGANFGDLRARTLSALAMAVVGVGAIWLGGLVFAGLAVVLAGLMTWELHKMTQPDAAPNQAEAYGVAAGILVGVMSFYQSGLLSMIGLALGALILAWRVDRDRRVFGAYFLMILWAAHALIVMREIGGLAFVLWLVLIVIASDVMGYFAGRILGGPKFWPRFSPKKTWSGTVAGWIGAGLVGFGFSAWLGLSIMIVPLSMLLALAGQLGDIAESAIKRRAGVKDSSALIPGHGGVLDRFDALIAVAALALILAGTGVFAGLQG